MVKKPRRRQRKNTLPLERRQKIASALSIFLGFLLLASLISHTTLDDRMILDGSVELFSLKESSQLVDNQGGVVGAYLALAHFFFFGWGAFLIPLWLLLVGANLWKPGPLRGAIRSSIWYSAAALLALALIDNFGDFATIAVASEWSAQDILTSAGGFISLKFNYVLIRYLGGVGSTLSLFAITAVVTLIALPSSMKLDSAPAPLKEGGKAARSMLGALMLRLRNSIRERRAEKRALKFRRATDAVNEAPALDDAFERRLQSALGAHNQRGTDSFESGPAPVIPPLQPSPRRQNDTPVGSENMSDDYTGSQTSLDLDEYELPSLDLLLDPPQKSDRGQQAEMAAVEEELRETLATFNVRIHGDVTMIPGPVVSRFEFRPAQGVKVNQILNLSDDLALALRAKRIRIVAPIPGKAAVGIEVPVRRREVVYLKDAIQSQHFASPEITLPLALGKNISGEPFVADLTRMPHLLIAGATGAGKSVCINAIITSMLYRLSPADLRFIFIDPKMLELSVYSGIPHLERPVVTNPRKAERVLADATIEMETRYKRLASHSVRNIADYNAKMSDPYKRIPYLVIVIDELADLMMTQTSAKTEAHLTRLAQMARAVGIHLILATQRPSVDVITGLIKANFPSRIAFHVASKTDSRTILDANGAEKLLGQGDMLLQWAGQPELIRLHGAYISSDETEQIVNSIKRQNVEVKRIETVSREIPDEEIEGDSSEGPTGNFGSEKADPLYNDAVKTVIHHKQASVSLLQRRLGIGYQRAARLVDKMEEVGIVGPSDGSRARPVLVDSSYLETIGEEEVSEERQFAG